jgi:hypothetical protein
MKAASLLMALLLLSGCGDRRDPPAAGTEGAAVTDTAATPAIGDTAAAADTAATPSDTAPASPAPDTATQQAQQPATRPASPKPAPKPKPAPAPAPASDTAKTATAPADTAPPADTAAGQTETATAPLRDAYHQAPKDTVDQGTYDGWKQYNLNCARCHGEDVLGTTIAPHLVVSLKPNGPINTQEAFVQVVCAGRPEKGMPAWCSLGLEPAKINQIYSYVKGRSEGKIGPGRPAVKQEG